MDSPQKTNYTRRLLLVAEYFMHKNALTTNISKRQRHEAEMGMQTIEASLEKDDRTAA